MLNCDFNKVALILYRNNTLAWVFSCEFAVYFRNPFLKNTFGGLLLTIAIVSKLFFCKNLFIRTFIKNLYEESLRIFL